MSTWELLHKCEYYLLYVIGVDENVFDYAVWLQGFELTTMNNVLQFATGYRSFDQLDDFEDFEDYEVRQ